MKAAYLHVCRDLLPHTHAGLRVCVFKYVAKKREVELGNECISHLKGKRIEKSAAQSAEQLWK